MNSIQSRKAVLDKDMHLPARGTRQPAMTVPAGTVVTIELCPAGSQSLSFKTLELSYTDRDKLYARLPNRRAFEVQVGDFTIQDSEYAVPDAA